MSTAMGLSFGLHGLAIAVMVLAGRFTWPAPPIPIEVVSRPSRPPAPPAPPAEPETPPPPARPKRAATAPGAGSDKPRRAAAPKTLSPPPTSDLKPFAPDGANLVVLLRSDKLRRSPHRADIEALLSALPDYDTLLGGTGLSPIDDLQALLIATADPRDMTATFLAARFKESPRIRAIGGRPLKPGDPRVFRFPQPGLAVLTRPDGAERLDGAQAPDAGSADPRVRWLKELAQFDRVAAAESGPALLVTFSDVPSLIKLGDGLPTPGALALAATAEGAPALRVKAVFASDDEAERMERALPDILKRYRSATALLGLSSALDGMAVTRRGAEIEIEGKVPEAQFRLALSWVRALLPPPPGQAAPPPLAVDLGEAPR